MVWRPANWRQAVRNLIFQLGLLLTFSPLQAEEVIDRHVVVDRHVKVPEQSAVDIELTSAERNWLTEHRVIRVGFDPEFAPFEFVDEQGRYSGIAADYLRLVGERLDIGIEVVNGLTWVEVMAQVRRGEIDLLPAVGQTLERSGYLNFTEPHTRFVRSIVTRDDLARSVTGLEDLQGLRVAVQSESSHDGYLRDHTTIEAVDYPTLQSALLALSHDDVDALVGNLASASYWMRELNLTNLRIAAQVSDQIQGLHMATRKDLPILRDLLQKALDTISDSKRAEISRRWVDVAEFLPESELPKLPLTPDERTWLESRPVIRIGIDPAWAPIEFIADDGSYQGVSAEYMSYLAAKLGVQFEPISGLPWDQVMAAARRGEIDLLPAVAETEERQAFLNFTETYLTFPLVVYTPVDGAYVSVLDDLAGRRVVVERDYLAHELLTTDHPALELLLVADSETALRYLVEGRADAYVGNLMVASHIIGSRGYTSLKVAAPTEYGYRLHMGVRKDWPELVPILQRALDTMSPQQKNAIQQKWVGVRYDLETDYRLFWRALAVGLLLLVAGGFWLQLVRRQRERLRISEERFQLAMAASEGVWDWNVRTNEVYYSPRYFTMLGYDPEEFKHGFEIWETLLHPEDRRQAKATVERAIAESASQYEHQFRLRCQDGSYRHIYSRGHVVADEQGRALRAVGVHTDVTKRVEAEENLQVFRRFADTSGQGMAIATLEGQVVYVNETMRQLVGESSVEAIYDNDYAYYFSEDIISLFEGEIGAALTENRQWTGELYITDRKGEEIPVVVNFFLLRDQHNKSSLVGSMFTDIRPQKEGESSLRHAREEAERANRFKSEFLANMSHEVRTPLNAIIGMTHLLGLTAMTPRQSDYVAKIDYSSQLLLTLVNDILDFSRIEAGRLELENVPFELDQLFEKLTTLRSRSANESSVELIYDIDADVPSQLEGDSTRLAQILINLIDNAMKFTSDGQVLVSVRFLGDSEGGAKLEFSVTDTGIGIEAEELLRVFEVFTQADGSTTRRYGGSGLGLAICKRLVTLMGGEIDVESEPGKGSTFRFTARFGVIGKTSRLATEQRSSFAGLQVLLADDNATTRRVVQNMLEELQCRVKSVANAAAVMAQLEKVQSAADDQPGGFDLLIVDSEMPGMDGIEVSRLIHSSTEFEGLSILLMLADGSEPEKLQQARQAGINVCIAKPVTASTLGEGMARVLLGERQAVARRSSETRLPVTPDLDGKQVLVVEDNRINQQVLRDLLEICAAEVAVAANGAEAVRMATEGDFSLILMDMQMPDMDGFQATRMLRRIPRLQELPIIAITAMALAGDRERCLDAGMNDYLSKPIVPEHFYRVVGRWIEAAPSNSQADLTTRPLPGWETLRLAFDVGAGLQTVRGNTQLYRQLIIEFLEDHRGDADLIRAYVANNDIDALKRALHTLEGVAGNLGARRLQSAAGDLADEISDPTLLEQFLVELTRVMDAIGEWRNSGSDSGAVKAAIEWPPELDQIESLLKEGNSGVVKYF
ncbi:MAG TPA: hypothetical protein DCF45_02025, partial [Gammaproteobacteria bacterium]|nr:hypothetical protein [Gammaproteobacteria bacterium]